MDSDHHGRSPGPDGRIRPTVLYVCPSLRIIVLFDIKNYNAANASAEKFALQCVGFLSIIETKLYQAISQPDKLNTIKIDNNR